MQRRKHQKTNYNKKGLSKFARSTAFVSIFFCSFLIGYLLTNSFRSTKSNIPKKEPQQSLEIKKILEGPTTKERSKWYLALIKRVGPEQAQEDLQHSGISFTGESHLLNHVVGNYLYKKFGPAGITKCKDYFSSSCYHGVIIDAIGGGKLNNIEIMLSECKKNGKPAYAQCSHALGHGFLAWAGYRNLLKALTMCNDIHQKVSDFDLYYCHNGVFMENVWGLHEGKPSPDAWLKSDDLHYPCDDPRIEPQYQPACWYNQAFQMNHMLNGDSVKVAFECLKAPDEASQNTCFDGVFRGLSSSTQGDLDTKFRVCRQMPEGWKEKCIGIQAGAGFQQGDRILPFTICARSTEQEKTTCYTDLQDMIRYYITNKIQQELLCKKIPHVYQGGVCQELQ